MSRCQRRRICKSSSVAIVRYVGCIMKKLLLVLITLIFMNNDAYAGSPDTYLVLGAISSGKEGEGVVLLKKRKGDAAIAVRVGAEVDRGIILFQVRDRYVYFKHGSEMLRVKIGEELESRSQPLAVLPGKGEIEVREGKVKVTQAYKDHLLKHELSKVLMQAAAVPYFQNGSLEGFKLVDIDAGSIYDQVGLKDGDVVTEINGQRLTDVGRAIKILQSMRDETNAEIKILRGGSEASIEINVH